MKRFRFLTIILLLILSPSAVLSAPMVLDNIPAYNWYHGCGPTAAASILGYYDLNGYGNLFSVSGWEDVRSTISVREEISSSAHNAKYDSNPDDSGLAAPEDTSIADFFHTSEGSLNYGWSYNSYTDSVFEDYALFKGYDSFDAYRVPWSGFSWEDLILEIDEGLRMKSYHGTNLTQILPGE